MGMINEQNMLTDVHSILFVQNVQSVKRVS